MEIIKAAFPQHLQQTQCLFREYAQSLGVDLDFQDFDAELAQLPGKYAPPGGILLLATEGGSARGCVALRPLSPGVCEMKRLYVRPAARGRGFGVALARAVLDEAARLGYATMRLDTLERLSEAMRLYETLGFRRIPAYYANPLPEVVYWELDLKRWPGGPNPALP